MLNCWNDVTEKRPSFEELVKHLTRQLIVVSEYLDLSGVQTENEYLKAALDI